MDTMMPQIQTVKNLSDLDFEPQDFDVVYCTDTDQFMIYYDDMQEWVPIAKVQGTASAQYTVVYNPEPIVDKPPREFLN